jgi:hypothetical protein
MATKYSKSCSTPLGIKKPNQNHSNIISYSLGWLKFLKSGK